MKPLDIEARMPNDAERAMYRNYGTQVNAKVSDSGGNER